MFTKTKSGQFLLLAIGLLMLTSAPAFAAAAAGSGMPWEAPLQLIMTSITGPVAGIIALLGITVAGGMLMFGGELGEFARRIVMMVLVLGLLVSAANLLTLLFAGTGAVI